MVQGVVGESSKANQTYHPAEIEKAFHEFISKYGKRYTTSEQYHVAKDAFAENLRTIESLRPSGEVGLNDYAELALPMYHVSSSAKRGSALPSRNSDVSLTQHEAPENQRRLRIIHWYSLDIGNSTFEIKSFD
ncbi:hypothetical protein FOZ62_031800 [Perkinsus olseni]|uniref:Cathepsin propeptide inhibitor domain-containing protein n=1 Tax=Perkinsus olseni TaxID=32597 RepID=A0A7J6QSB2_PEROL|nr:hypothetical protein FOZ62_031800 [Perkinsus olseni]